MSMAINIPTQVEFIQRLYREGRIGLDAVYDIFYKTRGSKNSEALHAILLNHYADGESGELVVLERGSDTDVDLLDEAV
ncbi:hypothetical protein [Denitromonas iodatirespirans]|uniref:Uncharacterized protein n=1 Tax=Denitromonas iodatirespirans TaxID=2795389 RepID=A0A944HAE4_DENI1|nr:hypothetical protein [Denitromonas iodatirespirans]MBT0963385.1 hypothetical protein [Denitromonas iodatirespirans]